MKTLNLSVFFSALIFLFFAAHFSFAQDVFPGKSWEKIKNPVELG